MPDGRWDAAYAGSPGRRPYGESVTYDIGVSWLAPCADVQDWGCGLGWFGQLRLPRETTGVDGSCTPFANITHDLQTIDTSCDGIFMRHVIEHNDDWLPILRNACASFRERMCLVLFTPFHTETHVWYSETMAAGPVIPTYRFALADLLAVFPDDVRITPLFDLRSPNTQWNVEQVLLCEREP